MPTKLSDNYDIKFFLNNIRAEYDLVSVCGCLFLPLLPIYSFGIFKATIIKIIINFNNIQ